MTAPLLLRIGEVAALLGVSRATCYRMAADGELAGVVTIRGHLRVHRPTLEQHLAELAGADPGPTPLGVGGDAGVNGDR